MLGCSDPEPEATASRPAEPMPAEASRQATPSMRAGTVTETMSAAGYTYLQVDTGEEIFWAAAPVMSVEVGDDVIVPAGMAMQDFHSSALDRDFDVVYFVDAVQVGDAPVGDPQLPSGHPPVGNRADAAPTSVDAVEQLEGGLRVADIVAGGAELAGKTVSFRGQVVKFNPNIMGTNWLHVQDGSGEPGSADITVRTSDEAAVGQTVVVRGVVATDQDFGFGYAYDVLVENATVTAE